jgi:hypothetical protein
LTRTAHDSVMLRSHAVLVALLLAQPSVSTLGNQDSALPFVKFATLIPPLPRLVSTVTDYTDYVELNRPDPAYFSRRVTVLLERGDMPAALAAARKLVEVGGTTTSLGWATVANLFLRSSRIDAAEDAARRAISTAAGARLGIRPYRLLLDLVLDIRRGLEAEKRWASEGEQQQRDPVDLIVPAAVARADTLWCADDRTEQCGPTDCGTAMGQQQCRRTCGRCGKAAIDALPDDWMRLNDPSAENLDIEDRCDLDRVDAQKTNISTFVAEYLAKGRPAIVSGLLDGDEGWAPARDWGAALDKDLTNMSAAAHFVHAELAAAVLGARNTCVYPLSDVLSVVPFHPRGPHSARLPCQAKMGLTQKRLGGRVAQVHKP